ncbi:MAG: PKD domain-containing protein [Mariniphaga sp.]|nr:PKD domain-containing protein [Mariniphaga sp.]
MNTFRTNLQTRSEMKVSLIITFLFSLLFFTSQAGIGETDEHGWTVLLPAANTRIYYVDATLGNDATARYYEASSFTDVRNPGEVNAYKTITAATNAAREGYPDWILLKRGEEWKNESLGRFRSGQNANNPIIISYYGTTGDRPLIKNTENFIDHNGKTKSNFVLHGLHIYNYRHDPNSPDFNPDQTGKTLRLVGSGENILIEDCKLNFNEIVVQGYDGKYRNVSIRRSIILDNYYKNSAKDNNSRPSGIFASEVHGLRIEQCVFDHNGWNEDVPGAAANMYNHNLYLTYNCSGKEVINNIITRGAAQGLQLRGCGIVEENLFVQNAVAMNLGYHGHQSVYDTIAIAKNNVILEGRQMDPEGITGGLSTGAVWGIWTSYERFLVENNIIANKIASINGNAFPIDNGAITDYVNNIVYKWDNNKNMNDPQWIDPNRSVGSYHGFLGKTETLEAFLKEVRNRPLAEWPEEYEAKTVNNYIREGFSYAGNNNPVVTFTSSGTDTDYAPVTVNFTSDASDPDNDNLKYIWKFEDKFFYNDGTSRNVDYDFSTEENPSYTYTYPGTYRITLTVYDGKGGTDTYIDSVEITGNFRPVGTINPSAVSGNAPLIVQFDASGSYDENNDQLTYHYDFGDGTTAQNTSPRVSHVYAPGTHQVTFWVKDGSMQSFEKKITIEVSDPRTETSTFPVNADAFLDAESPDANFGAVLNSRIDNTSRHGIFRVKYPLDGNEIINASLHIASKYGTNACALKYVADDNWEETTVTWNNQPESTTLIGTSDYQDGWGVFDITEAVKNEKDSTISALLYETDAGWQEFRYRETSYAIPFLKIKNKIKTDNHSPIANISADVVQGNTPLTVNLNGTESTDADGDEITYLWDFGDGTENRTGENVQHVFPAEGNYIITLIVDDGNPLKYGSKSFSTIEIFAGEPVNNINQISINEITIFPNPANSGKLNYIVPEENSAYKILDIRGNVVAENRSISRTGTIDVSSLRSGIYLFVVNDKKTMISRRFIVQ